MIKLCVGVGVDAAQWHADTRALGPATWVRAGTKTQARANAHAGVPNPGQWYNRACR